MLLAQLHAHPRRYDEILSRHLPCLLAAFDEQPPAWWFTRHREMARPDADQRLDLTLHLPPEAYGTAAQYIRTWADNLHRLGLSSGLILAPYQPQTGRFGRAAAMDAAHQVFAADSAAALAQIQLTERTDAVARRPSPQPAPCASSPSGAEQRRSRGVVGAQPPAEQGRLDRPCVARCSNSPRRTAPPLAALLAAPQSPKRGGPAPLPWTPTGTP
ncbi:thiopeptide-type bacteriocin biosynthesis protein [Streptomyces sp. M10(2022)]